MRKLILSVVLTAIVTVLSIAQVAAAGVGPTP
jgi:hypothetical protein